MKTKTLALCFLLALAAGCSSPDNTLEGKWVVDKEWIDTIPTPQSDEEAMAIYGVQMGMVEMVSGFLPIIYFEFVPDGPAYRGVASGEETQITETHPSWQVRGDWVIFPEADSLEFHWLDEGKLQLISDRSMTAGTMTMVRAE